MMTDEKGVRGHKWIERLFYWLSGIDAHGRLQVSAVVGG